MTSSASCFLPQSHQSSTTLMEAIFCQCFSSQSIKSEYVAPQVDPYSSMVLCAQCECAWWPRASRLSVLIEIQYSTARCHRSMLKMLYMRGFVSAGAIMATGVCPPPSPLYLASLHMGETLQCSCIYWSHWPQHSPLLTPPGHSRWNVNLKQQVLPGHAILGARRKMGTSFLTYNTRNTQFQYLHMCIHVHKPYRCVHVVYQHSEK